MTYAVSSGTLNSSIYYTFCVRFLMLYAEIIGLVQLWPWPWPWVELTDLGLGLKEWALAIESVVLLTSLCNNTA